MISIRYILMTEFYDDIKDLKPVSIHRAYNSKGAAQKDMLSSTIEELSKGKSGIIKEDCTITWRGDDKHDYVQRVVFVEIIK